MKGRAILGVAVFVVFTSTVFLHAQESAPPPQPDGQILPPAQLDALTGPIALYPDVLVSEILPAATLASQIVLADNYVLQGGDPNAIDQQPWDDSVKALARYPDVLHYMDANLQWTVALGQAYLDQPDDVMDSIQRLRAEAQSEGNLQSTPQQDVETDDGEIEIVPTDPDSIYVPSYNPGIVYYEPGVGITFGAAFPIGVWLHHDFDWHNHHIFVWDHNHPRPHDWWHRPIAERRQLVSQHPVYHPVVHTAYRGTATQGGFDRGYVNRDVHRVEPAHVEAPHPQPNRGRPAANPVQVHTIPARPTVSAFVNVQNATAAREASERGAASRATVSLATRPAPSGGGRPSGGGGGGHPAGGGGGGGRPGGKR